MSVLHNIVRNANEALKKKYLPGFCDGSILGALALTEPGAGSDALGSMTTTAKLDGDKYIVNGRKCHQFGTSSRCHLTLRKNQPRSWRHGVSAFLLDTKAPVLK